MFTRSISGRFPPAGVFGDEVNLRFYREEEAHSAAGLPFARDLERALDGRGGDPHPVIECALTDLDSHPYHLGAPITSVLLSGYRSAIPPLAALTKERTAGPCAAFAHTPIRETSLCLA